MKYPPPAARIPAFTARSRNITGPEVSKEGGRTVPSFADIKQTLENAAKRIAELGDSL